MYYSNFCYIYNKYTTLANNKKLIIWTLFITLKQIYDILLKMIKLNTNYKSILLVFFFIISMTICSLKLLYNIRFWHSNKKCN